MPSKQEVLEIMAYCKENESTYKSRLRELNIKPWRFFDAKRKYIECPEVIPAKVGIKETVRHKVMLVSDMEKHPEEREIITPGLPLAPIPRCIAGASLLASIVIDKYMYSLPLYRQIQQYKEYGVILNDSTMGVPVIDNEKHKTRKGYEWCVRDGITGI